MSNVPRAWTRSSVGVVGLSVRGLVVGGTVGALGLLAPGLGIVLGAVAALLLLRLAPRFWALGGGLVGAGLAWLLLLWRAMASCQSIIAPNYESDCRPPDLGPYVATAVGFIIVGGAAWAVSTIIERRRVARGNHDAAASSREEEG